MNQEFRDRCARAMGWSIRDDRYRGSVRVWQWTTGEDDVRGFWYDEWKPDEDYNQAMMMRDNAGQFDSYSFADTLQAMLGGGSPGGYSANIAHATALQIATAALSVLEKRQGDSQ